MVVAVAVAPAQPYAEVARKSLERGGGIKTRDAFKPSFCGGALRR